MGGNFYYGFFKYLYDIYDISGWTAIDQFVLPHIQDTQKLTDTLHIKAMLNELENRKIIEWKADKTTTDENGVTSTHWQNIPRYKRDLGKDDNHTFDNTRVEVKLTPDVGLDYAVNIVNSQVIRDSTLTTNKWMTGLTFFLVIIGALTVIVQMKQCCVSQQQFHKQSQQETPQRLPYNQQELKQNATVYDTTHKEPTLEEHNKVPSSLSLNDSSNSKRSDTIALKQNTVKQKKRK